MVWATLANEILCCDLSPTLCCAGAVILLSYNHLSKHGAFQTVAPDFILTDPAVKSTGLEAAEINRQLQGYFQPREHNRRHGESQEEMLNKTQSLTMLVTSVKPFMEPPSLIAGKCGCVAACFPSFQPWQPLFSGAPRESSAKYSSLGLGSDGISNKGSHTAKPRAEKGWSVAER